MTLTYPAGEHSVHTLKEQLRFHAFNGSSPESLNVLASVRLKLNKRERLATLLEGELNFHGENSGYASHDLHAFAAKFPPQLPRAFIRGLTEPGDRVLDPMMGSGTAVVEALIEGRRGVGLDIDPLAIHLSHVKTTPLGVDYLRNAGNTVMRRVNTLISEEKKLDRQIREAFDESTKAFIDYWFLPTTQHELMALILAIQEETDPSTRRFLELTFSSIIVTKSGGVSRARDLAHSRPHLDNDKVPKNALEQFSLRLKKSITSIAQLKRDDLPVALLTCDAKHIPLADSTIDLIVTSPPYANAIDYMRAHKFSLVWFGRTVQDLSELRSRYIGSERIGHADHAKLPSGPSEIIRQLGERDSKKAAIFRKYLIEMRSALGEMYRVLLGGSAAIVVVGTSVMRNIDIQTQNCLSDIAAEMGFDVVGVVQRVLDRNKRMMPARFGKKSDSMIEQRMSEEYVIGLIKPEHH